MTFVCFDYDSTMKIPNVCSVRASLFPFFRTSYLPKYNTHSITSLLFRKKKHSVLYSKSSMQVTILLPFPLPPPHLLSFFLPPISPPLLAPLITISPPHLPLPLCPSVQPSSISSPPPPSPPLPSPSANMSEPFHISRNPSSPTLASGSHFERDVLC